MKAAPVLAPALIFVSLFAADIPAAAQILFTEDFESDPTANWTVNKSSSKNYADFYFDYSTVGIPSAPRSSGGSTRGVKLEANTSNNIFGGLSVSPTGKTFTGDYVLRFDMWLNYNGPLDVAGNESTHITGGGVGTGGTSAQWAGSVQDSVHFGASGDGRSSSDYRAYSTAEPTGYPDASEIFAASGTGNRNNSHSYYAGFGGKSAPAGQLNLYAQQTGLTPIGSLGFAWHDVVITKLDGNVTFDIDGLRIATVPLSSGVRLGGNNILLTHYDVNPTSAGDPEAPDLLFGLIDNVTVSVWAAPPLCSPYEPTLALDGQVTVSGPAYRRGSAQAALCTAFTNGTILYTLDGSDPSVSAILYSGPFTIRRSATLRSIAYNEDFTQSAERDPIEVIILPTIAANTPGGGSVEIFPQSGAYLSNSIAMATASASPGWTFLHWLGDAEGTNPVVEVTMTSEKCVQAVFGTSINTNVIGSGSVLIYPLTKLYPFGSVARLTAIPQAGNYFVQWGIAASGTNNPLSFLVANANPTVASLYASLSGGQSFALTIIADGDGQVTVNPQANRYSNGANVTLTASPASGQAFLNWNGDGSGTNNPLVVTMNQSRVITAQFTKRPRLGISSCGGGHGDQGFRFTLQGEFGAVYRIDSSRNLPLWTPLATITNLYGTTQITDIAATNLPHRFYRAERFP